MNLMPSAEQEEIASSSRAFLADQLPMRRIRQLIEADDPVDEKVWRASAELGWFGLGLPEAVGGIGFALADEAVLFREIGRSLAPGPYLSTVLAARVAGLGGAEPLGAELVSGERRAALAIASAPISMEGAGLSGPVRVLDGVGATHLLVVDGTGAALVDLEEVLDLERERCIDDSSRLSCGRLADSPVIARVGPDAAVHRRGLVLSAALLVGMAEQCRDLSVEHARSREQFGRPIGIHQAVKHPIADMAVRAEAAWSQTVVAACAHDEDRADAGFHSLSARITAAAARESSARTVQVMGGMGFTDEHDAHLFVKRAVVVTNTLGGDKALLAQLLTEPRQ
jgi:alkylation response protein AidB-like acyl-CoA dehydrogenase